MKFNIKYITFSALLCASMVSCDLDVVPPSDISTETFWKNEKDAWNGLNALYAELPAWISGMKCIPITRIAINRGKVPMSWYKPMVSRQGMILVMVIVQSA